MISELRSALSTHAKDGLFKPIKAERICVPVNHMRKVKSLMLHGNVREIRSLSVKI
jgi:hypothetical protein